MSSSGFAPSFPYQNVSTELGRSLQTSPGNETNASVTPESADCVVLQFGEFIPWDIPDNIVSKDVEDLIHKFCNLFFLPVTFLISCPANIINMLVFYKQGLRERINVCLFALSLSDELFMISNMLWFGDQLIIHFTTKEAFGPVFSFLVNHNLMGFYGFQWVSQILTAIIASERCFCILQPLRSQTVLRTSTMTAIIVVINVVTVGLFFLIASRSRTACAYDPLSDSVILTLIPSEFFIRNETFIVHLDIFVFGVGLSGLVMVVVTTTTIITAIKLRQAVKWRTGTSLVSSSGVSQRQVVLTKMLVANSAVFLACVFPFFIFRYGPVMQFFANNNLLGFHAFIWISQVLSAIIASERCFCILQPLRSQTVLRTSTMTAIIVAVHVVIIGIYTLVSTRYRVVCTYDPISKTVTMLPTPSEFFLRHEMLIIYLDAFVFGAALPGVVIIVVVTTTIITTIKLRQAVEWRAGASSASSNVMSQRELALTEMLVANSTFFLACVFPFLVFRFLFIFMPEVNNTRRQHNFYMFIQWILMIVSYLNCTFNFVIYYTMGSRFRQTFWELFGKTRCKD